MHSLYTETAVLGHEVYLAQPRFLDVWISSFYVLCDLMQRPNIKVFDLIKAYDAHGSSLGQTECLVYGEDLKMPGFIWAGVLCKKAGEWRSHWTFASSLRSQRSNLHITLACISDQCGSIIFRGRNELYGKWSNTDDESIKGLC